MLPFERLSSSEYVLSSSPEYLDKLNLHRLYDKLEFKSNLILVGPKGVGKSLSVAAYCRDRSYPMVTVDCSEDTRRAQLIGNFILRGNETPFILGPIPTAFEVANEVGFCVLILEEINALSPQMQKVLNPITDFRRKLEVAEIGSVFRLKGEAKLWVVGTMNSSSAYAGVFPVNEDLKSRFRILPLDYSDSAVERSIIESALRAAGLSLPAADSGHPSLIDKLLVWAKETRQGKFEYALSTRDLIQISTDIATIGIDNAILLSLGKFEDENRSAVRLRIKSIFGIEPMKIRI